MGFPHRTLLNANRVEAPDFSNILRLSFELFE